MSDTQTNVPSILRLAQPKRLSDPTETPTIDRQDSKLSAIRGTAYETSGTNALAKTIEIDIFYDAPPGTVSQMLTALDLLKQTIELLAQAQRSEDAMEADRFAQRAQLLLPKLFACRAIGDGFGVVINSLYIAFANLDGSPMNREQLKVTWRILRELRSIPAMSVDHGIRLVDEMEAAGLEVDAAEIGALLEGFESIENE
jgi:hypothetical protein